jgi:hypothetical protein
MEIIELGLDELEAMRLCDSDGMQQEEAADTMGVSRGTIQRLLESGRRKTLDALVNGQALSFADADHVCIRPINKAAAGGTAKVLCLHNWVPGMSLPSSRFEVAIEISKCSGFLSRRNKEGIPEGDPFLQAATIF